MPRSHGRKAWVKIETRIVHEELDRDQVATLVYLLCHLNDRWARDGKSAEEACHAVLDKPTIMRITGKHRADVALKSLRCLADVVSISIELRGDFVEIHWPKFAKTQSLGGLCPPHEAATVTENADADADADRTTHTHREGAGVSPEEKATYQPPPWVDVARILTAISGEPGTPEEKTAWLHRDLALMVSEIESDPKLARPANKAAALAALGVRYYRRRNDAPRKTKVTTELKRSGYETSAERGTRLAEGLIEKATTGGST